MLFALTHLARREYYFQMFAVIIAVAFINGTVLLPVVLSFLGAPNVRGETVSRRESMAAGKVEGQAYTITTTTHL